MISLTPEEEKILRPAYDKWVTAQASSLNYGYCAPMIDFDTWWRAKADQLKDEGK